MSTTATVTARVPIVAALPVARPPERPLDPPDELTALREHAPLARLRYPDGHLGWLATGFEQVRAVLSDRRFSSRYELMHFPIGGTALTEELTELPPAPLGDLTGIDPPEHDRLRRPLITWFTAHRMRALGERVGQIAAELLDELSARDPDAGPVDLVASYARPLPARVISELLGVPDSERESFGEHTLTLTDFASTLEQKSAAMTAMNDLLQELVAAKRAAPTEDLLGTLAGQLAENGLTETELAALGWFLLAAGFDTTANMISLGTLALLEHPEQLALLRADPVSTAGPAVEELLRWLTIANLGLRAATEDVEVGGVAIAAGESVTLAVQAANRDPRRFPDPDVLDLRRRTTGQLAFGHGIHQCLGHQLARVELQVALPALLTRFPDLRLAVPATEVPLRPDANLFGAAELPVHTNARGDLA